jgi:hypothetical protein
MFRNQSIKALKKGVMLYPQLITSQTVCCSLPIRCYRELFLCARDKWGDCGAAKVTEVGY